MTKGETIVAALIGLLCCGLVADCAGGKTRFFHCRVTNHRYVPEEVTITTDSDGRIQTSTSPEEFHVACSSIDGPEVFDVNTTRWRYNATRDGQIVWVSIREGRWTGVPWCPIIEDHQPPPEQ